MATDELLSSEEYDPLLDPTPGAAAPTADAETPEPADDEYEEEDESPHRRFSLRGLLRNVSACGISMLVHIVGIVILGLMTFDEITEAASQMLVATAPEEIVDPPVEVELDKEIEVVTEETVSVFSAAMPVGMVGGATGGGSLAAGTPTLDTSVVQRAEATQIGIEAPTIGMLDSRVLVAEVPDGDVKGEARDIVDSYQTAMDRIAQEIIWMLEKGPVLAIWVFDQSESMKDDQQEIRDRFNNIYNQLGIVGTSNNDSLLTAVCSYGNGFVDHTNGKATSNREEIRKAIDSVPVDPSGEEIMCSAVGRALTSYRDLAKRRQMCMILVTDESGNRDDNEMYLEKAIAAAKATKCKLYVMAREAVFGYPYCYISWKHPQTNRVHWLQIDRGPETGFAEQLQTNGFHRRHDAFSSGFGPYEETRMARETNGIFFMLPTVETNLVGAQKHVYELEAMRPYRPDLRARIEVFADRDKYPLRTLLWKVVQDLNPHNKQAQSSVELRVEFSLKPDEFLRQARQEQTKAKLHLQYMAAAEKALAEGRKLREQEAEPRWQANYDLIFAQLVAYQARTYEYGVALEAFIREPKLAPAVKGKLVLVDWNIGTNNLVRTEEAKPYIDRATVLFKEVQELHPGTPWAARAAWELSRGIGVDLHPDYEEPWVDYPNARPVPKF